MTNGSSNNHKIKSSSPYQGDPDLSVHLKMRYSIADEYYIFSYQAVVETQSAKFVGLSPALPEGETIFGKMRVEVGPDGIRRTIEKYFEDLDIGIRHGSGRVIVTVETVDNGNFKDMYWHQDPGPNPRIEAIMTKENREAHYGDLEYSDGLTWSKKIPAQPCRLIRFKAKEKSGNQENHKFSYNVRLPGFADFQEIDPDIQNPKVQ